MNAPTRPIAFIDLAAQRARIAGPVERAIQSVLAHGQFIMGPEVRELERQLAVFTGATHCISCANGTDALSMVLRARGVGPGDAVIVPSFTFAATAEVVALVGATPIFVDVFCDTFNIDPAGLAPAMARAQAMGLQVRAIIPVDLFGQPADYAPVEDFAASHGLFVLCDAAQSFGARLGARPVGVIGDATTTSFFPAKPLGCYGDGGAIFTNDDALAEALRSIRTHGQGSDKYDNVRIGVNGRLDTIQAAVLIEKLAIFADEIEARDRVAGRYARALSPHVCTPVVATGATSVWAQYTIRVDAGRRAALGKALAARGVPTAVYYPLPLHRQTAYRNYPVAGNGLPASERLADEVISLPMHPYLDEELQDYIIASVIAALAEVGA